MRIRTRLRGWETWDIEAPLSPYADDVEIVQIDRDNPPSAPRIRRGREVIAGWPSTALPRA